MGSVVLGMESERGYVPPRHRGALIAQERQTAIRLEGEPLLILQVDADTFYRPGYLTAMRRAAESAGPNVLLEARTEYPLDFVQQYPDYLDLCNAVDRSVERWFAPLDCDVIVDDKVSAYFLSDYFAWGGHQREYSLAKNEIHAETSRLYLRAKARKAKRCQVDSATASLQCDGSLRSHRFSLQQPAFRERILGAMRGSVITTAPKRSLSFTGTSRILRFNVRFECEKCTS